MRRFCLHVVFLYFAMATSLLAQSYPTRKTSLAKLSSGPAGALNPMSQEKDDSGLPTQNHRSPYPVVTDSWVQLAEFSSSDGMAGDEFGASIAISGTTMVVGAPFHTVGSNVAQGAAYVFVQQGKQWVQEAELTASDAATPGNFGYSVAISGTTLVVGAPNEKVGPNNAQGAAYVFVKSGGTWVQQAELVASDGASGDDFANSVAVSGSTVVVGAPLHPRSQTWGPGAAYVFVGSGGAWVQQAELIASDGASGNDFGASVAVRGTTALVGASGHTVRQLAQGAAYLFVEGNGAWAQEAELVASDPLPYSRFGFSVAISGNGAVIGAPAEYQPGSAYVFVESGGAWTQEAELTHSDGLQPSYTFGSSVAFGGNTVVVGESGNNVGSNSDQGAAYVFVRGGSAWTQQTQLTASDGQAYDYFGVSVALSGGTVFVGSSDHTVGSNGGQGTAYIFTPPATLTPPSATYPLQKVGTTSAAKTFMLTNYQTVPLTGLVVSSTGDFEVSAKTCGTSLAAESRCTVSVTFTPTATGERMGTLVVADSANNSPQTSSLLGTGN